MVSIWSQPLLDYSTKILSLAMDLKRLSVSKFMLLSVALWNLITGGGSCRDNDSRWTTRRQFFRKERSL